MTMENDLVERLRDVAEDWRKLSDPENEEVVKHAAAHIEALEAANDAVEIRAGLTENGNLWRFWADKAREIADKQNGLIVRIQALEAELARKTEALPDLSSVISWLEHGCDPKNGAKELRIYAARIAAALEEKTDV